MSIRAFVFALAALHFGGCSYALHPHRTLEGRSFKWEAVDTIHQGMAEADVAVTLGSPLEVLSNGPDATTWRYYERAQLQGCREELFGFIPWSDTPMRSTEARIHLRRHVVEMVEVVHGR